MGHGGKASIIQLTALKCNSISFDLQPFRNAMARKLPGQRTFFASWQRPQDIRDLSTMLVSKLLSLDYKRYCLGRVLGAYRLVRYSETISAFHGA